MRALVLVIVLLAGCVAPSTPTAPSPDARAAVGWAERAVPTGDGHDHFDLGQHKSLSTPNFEVLGWDPLLVDAHGGKTAGGYFCGEAATTKDGRRLAVVNSFTTDVAFVVVDVTDAARPQKVGEYTMTGSFAYDVALTPDGLHVIIAADPDQPDAPSATLTAPSWGLRWRDACTGIERPVSGGPEQMIPLGPSTVMIGIADPRNPVLEDVVPAPVLGPHSVSTALVDGKTFVVSSVTNIAHQASYYQFFLVGQSPLGPKLELQSVYQAPPPAEGEKPVVNGHVDASIMKHPVTGQVLAYLADWDAGVIVLDITNPRTPTQLSTFSEFAGGSYVTGQEEGNVHETLPVPGLWDGRHYVLAGQEIVSRPGDRPTGWVWILDDTDPAKLELVGKWTLPVDVDWEGQPLVFSTHYVALHERTLFVTLYHGGLWAVDLSTPEKLADPPTIGVFIPDRESPSPPPKGGHGVEGLPDVLDVLSYPDGTLAVFEASSGVYTVRFDATRPMTPPPTWQTQE